MFILAYISIEKLNKVNVRGYRRGNQKSRKWFTEGVIKKVESSLPKGQSKKSRVVYRSDNQKSLK